MRLANRGVRLANRVFVSFFCKISRVFSEKNSEKSFISARKKTSFFCGKKRGAPGLVRRHPFWAALGLGGARGRFRGQVILARKRRNARAVVSEMMRLSSFRDSKVSLFVTQKSIAVYRIGALWAVAPQNRSFGIPHQILIQQLTHVFRVNKDIYLSLYLSFSKGAIASP